MDVCQYLEYVRIKFKIMMIAKLNCMMCFSGFSSR